MWEHAVGTAGGAWLAHSREERGRQGTQLNLPHQSWGFVKALPFAVRWGFVGACFDLRRSSWDIECALCQPYRSCCDPVCPTRSLLGVRWFAFCGEAGWRRRTIPAAAWSSRSRSAAVFFFAGSCSWSTGVIAGDVLKYRCCTNTVTVTSHTRHHASDLPRRVGPARMVPPLPVVHDSIHV